jgi:ankyrin repeat protein
MRGPGRRSILGVLLVPVLLLGAAAPESPVADAAMRGDEVAVRTLIQGGADVNAAQGDGMTALHWAARHGDGELVSLLIRAGANVRAGTRIGRYTPLHLASLEAHAAVVEVLLGASADPNAATTNSGATPLHLAAASGDREVLRLLLAAGAQVDAREASWGQTPLIFAAAKNRVEAISVLLEAGADPSLAAHTVDTAEREAGDEAADERLMGLLEEFKKQEGGGPDWQPSPSQVQAAIEAAREVQRKWPNVGPEGEAEEENEEQDPESRPPSYAELVSGWGGLTPLLHAVRQGHREAVLALLEGGADIDQASEGDHTSPLLMASLNGQFDLARLLLERGADPNGASQAGATPLYAVLEREWAPRSSYSHPIEHQQQETTYLDMVRLLLEAGADPDVRLASHLWYMEYTFGVLRGSGIDLRGATPFWRAAYALDVDAMRLLREFGADPAVPCRRKRSRRSPRPRPRSRPRARRRQRRPPVRRSLPVRRRSRRLKRRKRSRRRTKTRTIPAFLRSRSVGPPSTRSMPPPGSGTGSRSRATRTATCPRAGWRRSASWSRRRAPT